MAQGRPAARQGRGASAAWPSATRCAARLGGFRVAKVVKIVAAIPATATGKLRKAELRREYQGLLG
jgi:acyl-CoA synthetase (AMP-forming)/AMP-acid ligase II